MGKQNIGLIGLGVMGQNLALNMESKGFLVAGFDIIGDKVDKFIKERARDKKITGVHSIEELCISLEKPRKIMIMVPAGKSVDDIINKLIPHLENGDIVIDGGNSYFIDTIRRTKYLEEKGFLYIGTGVSGGEEGALKGPSIMPGGSEKAWQYVQPIFQKIAARVADGSPCCEFVGPDGAGHFVKMVHNGIEYGDMQLICEAYSIMKNALNLSYPQLHKTFVEWNKGELDSYLIEITANILARKDKETGKPVVEIILDRAGQKGTGKWTSQIALDLGVPAPTIAEAVFARCISAIKEERVKASKILSGPNKKFTGNKKSFVKSIHNALYASKICSYAQGFALMKAAAKEYNWNLKFGEIALMWRGGCIIRARFLERIKSAFDCNPNLDNLLLDPFFKDIIEKSQDDWRLVITTAINLGIPVTAFGSALAYYDSYRSERLPANLLQAQRDYFGAHTYERTDKEGSFHTEWMGSSS